MKIQQKKRIIQKLWGWICLSINCLIISIFISKEVADFLSKGILLSVSIICYGVAKTQADKIKDDLSGTSVVIEYICLCLITLLSAIKVSDYLSSFSVLIVLAMSSFLELLIFLFITYWHTIRRFLFHALLERIC